MLSLLTADSQQDIDRLIRKLYLKSNFVAQIQDKIPHQQMVESNLGALDGFVITCSDPFLK